MAKSITSQTFTTTLTEIEQTSTVRPKPYKIYNVHTSPVYVLINGDNDYLTLDPGDILTVPAGTTASGYVDSGTADIQIMQHSLHKGSYNEQGYEVATDSSKVTVLNTISEEYSFETAADVTDEADASTDYFVAIDGKSTTIQFVQSGGTDVIGMTVHGTVQADGTAADSCKYIDITENGCDWLHESTASGTVYDEGLVKPKEDTGLKYLKLTAARSEGSADDADYAIYVVKKSL